MNKNTLKLFKNKIILIYLLVTIVSSTVLSGCSKKVLDVKNHSEEISTPKITVENTISASDSTASEITDSKSSNNSIAGNDESNDSGMSYNDTPDNMTGVSVSDSYTPKFTSPYGFYDVFRNSREMDINEAVSPNPYNPDCYSYYDKDATGNTIAPSTVPYECNTKPGSAPDIQMQGYSGIIKYDDGIYTSRFGIDVSKFQGKINWEKVKNAGVQFVFVRVGFRGYGQAGDLKEDAYFRKNIEGAKSSGLDVGVYFYAQAVNEEEAYEEAEFVLNLVDGYNLDLPIVYDPEHVLNDTARTDNVTGEQFTKNARAFSDKISASGYSPMIYANMMWEAYELDLSKLSDVNIWYADYENKPQSPYNFTVWQYSQNGKISGIDGPVDLNIMYVPK